MKTLLARCAVVGTLVATRLAFADPINSVSAEMAFLNNTGTYFSGAGVKLSRDFVPGLGVEAGVFNYRVVNYLRAGDNYSVLPVSLVARGTWQVVSALDLFGYVGIQKNFSQAPLDTTSLDIGLGALVHLGDSYGLRADAGPAAFGAGLSFLF